MSIVNACSELRLGSDENEGGDDLFDIEEEQQLKQDRVSQPPRHILSLCVTRNEPHRSRLGFFQLYRISLVDLQRPGTCFQLLYPRTPPRYRNLFWYYYYYAMPRPHRAEALSDDACLTSV